MGSCHRGGSFEFESIPEQHSSLTGSKQQTRADIFGFEQRILSQNRLFAVAGCEPTQDMLNRNPHVPDYWFAAVYLWPERYSVQKFLFLIHQIPSLRPILRHHHLGPAAI